jgi:hypothetical protein
VAFISSTAPDDGGSVRYVLILWPALLTLGVILYPRRGPAVIAAVAAVAAALGCIQLARGDYTAPIARTPHGEELDRIEEFVTARGADHGYAGYWDAMTITLQTDFDLDIYPVQPCPDGMGLCPSLLSRLDSWYIPRPETRSFYLVNPVGGLPRVPPPPPSWGRPLATGAFDGATVYVYGFDLASELRPVP